MLNAYDYAVFEKRYNPIMWECEVVRGLVKRSVIKMVLQHLQMAHLSESVSLWTPTGLGSTGMLKEHHHDTINLQNPEDRLCESV